MLIIELYNLLFDFTNKMIEKDNNEYLHINWKVYKYRKGQEVEKLIRKEEKEEDWCTNWNPCNYKMGLDGDWPVEKEKEEEWCTNWNPCWNGFSKETDWI